MLGAGGWLAGVGRGKTGWPEGRLLGAGGWLAGVGRGKIGWSEPGLGFGGASLTEGPTAGGGGAMAGRRFEGEGGDGVVVILFSDTAWLTGASTN